MGGGGEVQGGKDVEGALLKFWRPSKKLALIWGHSERENWAIWGWQEV